MRRRRRQRGLADSSLSFLDVISGGFGAIILLVVLAKIGEPIVLEEARRDLDGLVVQLQQELQEIRGETEILNRDMSTRQEQLSAEQARIARLQGDLTKIRGQYAASRQRSEVSQIIQRQLMAAQQTLTEEMRRLPPPVPPPPPSDLVGGIPVDSEYIIFIIDTSGSMLRTWSLVMQKIEETLDVYPRVKGLQIMNDMGNYLYSSYAGKWIPDTPARRKAILERLRNWRVFSNSSPVEGITRAIRTFARPDKKISLYVFGDEFSGPSIDAVVRTVRRLNGDGPEGRRVRIHAIGFPTVFILGGGLDVTGIRFATLMRILSRENGGTFVALNNIRP